MLLPRSAISTSTSAMSSSGYSKAISPPFGEGRATPDDIHGAFRAVHSIKGGAGAFALTELVEFAHMFEACLDALRSGKVAVEDAPIDMLLQAGDVLNEQIGAARDGRSSPVGPDLVAALQAMAGRQDRGAQARRRDLPRRRRARAPPPARRSGRGRGAAPAPARPGAPPRSRSDAPDKDFFRRAIDPRMIFDALRHLGPIEVDLRHLPGALHRDPRPGRVLDGVGCRAGDRQLGRAHRRGAGILPGRRGVPRRRRAARRPRRPSRSPPAESAAATSEPAAPARPEPERGA